MGGYAFKRVGASPELRQPMYDVNRQQSAGATLCQFDLRRRGLSGCWELENYATTVNYVFQWLYDDEDFKAKLSCADSLIWRKYKNAEQLFV